MVGHCPEPCRGAEATDSDPSTAFRAGAARPSSKHAARRSRLEAVTAFSPFSTGKGEPFLPGDCCWKFT